MNLQKTMKNFHFSNSINSWYLQNKRHLPWRETTDPYLIWLSEVIMQQTRIDQGTDYYLRFVDRFETIFDLANASEEEILKMWQGLGYYSRARNLHSTAKHIAYNLGGQFPDSYNRIMELKGIGPYTAAAIASICFNEAQAAIDGNVYRVLTRFKGIDLPIDSTPGKKTIALLANELIDQKNPGDFNQALMDLGSQVCTPQKPRCEECPLFSECEAFRSNQVLKYPVKKSATKQTNRYFYYIIVRNEDQIFIRKRTAKDIWLGLYDFPLIESESPRTTEELATNPIWEQIHTDFDIRSITQHKSYIHKLSHQIIHATFYEIEVKFQLHPQNDFKIIDKNYIFELAIPRLIELHLADVNWL
jgi:A/G-specific adenine glycosylase